jgi:dCTP deaminase
VEGEVILTGPEILRQVKLGEIEIDPFVPEHVNPASVDLTLGREIMEYDVPEECGRRRNWLDAREKNPTFTHMMGERYLLEPGRLYLMHTIERVCAKKFVPVLDGKSSLARLGVSIHATAGFGDPGFDGQWTLEVTCVLPVRLYAGMRVAQMRFHAVQGEVEQYAGNYVGEASRGPVASRSWRQFK